MTSLAEQLTSREAVLDNETRSKLRRLVVDYADGRQSDLDVIVVQLAQLETTPTEFEELVELLKSRRSDAAIVKSAASVNEDYVTAQDAVQAEQDAFAQLKLEHLKRLRPLADNVKAIQNLIADSMAARKRLIDSASHEAKAVAFIEIDRQKAGLSEERKSLQKRVANKERYIADLQDDKAIDEAETQLASIKQEMADWRVKNEELQRDEQTALDSLCVSELI